MPQGVAPGCYVAPDGFVVRIFAYKVCMHSVCTHVVALPEYNANINLYAAMFLLMQEWEESGRMSPTPNMESFPPQPDCVTEILSMDQLSSHNSDGVVPASVSLHQSEQRNGQEKMRCDPPMKCSDHDVMMEWFIPFMVSYVWGKH